MRPLLSVVIPTYNRYQYLVGCLKATTAIKTAEMEIVVHDNTENNEEILPVISALSDPRIKYYHEQKHISVVENSDRGVTLSTGEYVTMIGDDDTICESMMQAARFCKENGIEACMASIPGYNWPDMTFVGEAEPNLFYLKKADGTVREIDAKAILKNAVHTAEGLPGDMPRIYHGMVSKACLDRIKDRCGTYFPGPSPDMANATAVSLESRKTVFITDYLMVSGYGYKSSRGEGNRKVHFGKISDKPWLPADTEAKWDKNIPRIFSAETIFAQSLINALRRMDQEDLANQYNYGALYAQFLAHHRETSGYMLRFCLTKPYRAVWLIKGIIERQKIRKAYFASNVRNQEKYYLQKADIHTLSEAQEYTNQLREQLCAGIYHWQ